MVKLVEKVPSADGQAVHHVVRVSVYFSDDGKVDEVVVDECSLPGSDMAFDGLLDAVSKPIVDVVREWSLK